MALPKRKISRTRGRKRRAHDALKRAGRTLCAHCQASKLPHRICPNCGFYRGREVVSQETE